MIKCIKTSNSEKLNFSFHFFYSFWIIVKKCDIYIIHWRILHNLRLYGSETLYRGGTIYYLVIRMSESFSIFSLVCSFLSHPTISLEWLGTIVMLKILFICHKKDHDLWLYRDENKIHCDDPRKALWILFYHLECWKDTNTPCFNCLSELARFNFPIGYSKSL